MFSLRNQLIYCLLISAVNIPSVFAQQLDSSQCAFSGVFTQTRILQGLTEPLETNGVLFFHCEQGVIWKTTDPVIESLVLSKREAKQQGSYVIRDDTIKPLASRQSKILGNIILGLMSDDQSSLTNQFEFTETEQNTMMLTPKRKRLKRAIKSISVTSATIAGGEQRIIEMLDKRDQQTRIVSSKLIDYPTQDGLKNCSSVEQLSTRECNLLFNIEPGTDNQD